MNIKAALLHVIGDLLGSVAAIVAGIVILVKSFLPFQMVLKLFAVIFLSYKKVGDKCTWWAPQASTLIDGLCVIRRGRFDSYTFSPL